MWFVFGGLRFGFTRIWIEGSGQGSGSGLRV